MFLIHDVTIIYLTLLNQAFESGVRLGSTDTLDCGMQVSSVVRHNGTHASPVAGLAVKTDNVVVTNTRQ